MTTLWSPDSAATPQHGADKYHGTVAEGYDTKRENSPKWIAEQRIIESMLDGYGPGTVVLDIPIGTGRFLEAYHKRGFQVVACDISQDMIGRAIKKALESDRQEPIRNIRFWQQDVRDLNLIEDKSVDIAVMCRLTRWLSPEDCTKAIQELARVTRKRIIFTARVRNHPHARLYELFQVDGWKIARDEAGYQEDYRIIAMEPV